MLRTYASLKLPLILILQNVESRSQRFPLHSAHPLKRGSGKGQFAMQKRCMQRMIRGSQNSGSIRGDKNIEKKESWKRRLDSIMGTTINGEKPVKN